MIPHQKFLYVFICWMLAKCSKNNIPKMPFQIHFETHSCFYIHSLLHTMDFVITDSLCNLFLYSKFSNKSNKIANIETGLAIAWLEWWETFFGILCFEWIFHCFATLCNILVCYALWIIWIFKIFALLLRKFRKMK